jgi:hypothetical protein
LINFITAILTTNVSRIKIGLKSDTDMLIMPS